jgi:hypothetical protein
MPVVPDPVLGSRVRGTLKKIQEKKIMPSGIPLFNR